MATIVNARDVILQAAGTRLLAVTVGSNVSVPIPQVPGLGAAITGVSLTGSSSVFQIPKAGTPITPSSITVTATLRNLTGTASLTLVAGTMSVSPSLTGGAFTFTPAQMTSDGITLRLSLSGYTSDFTVVKVREGQDGSGGSPGAPGNQAATAYLYAWSTSAPSNPNGSSTYTWATAAHTSFSGPTWSTAVGSNPGGPGIKLWVAAQSVTATAGTTSSTVTWPSSGSGYSVYAAAVNGNDGGTGPTGPSGATGYQSAYARVYQWATSTPGAPSGSPSWTWASASFGAAPSGWTLTPGTPPSAGFTLWSASVLISASAAATSTSFNWTSSAIDAIGYAGTNGGTGGTGPTGPQGASARTAYSRIAGNPVPTSGNITTAGSTSYPTSGQSNSVWSVNVSWTGTDPNPASTDTLYQTDGFYDPATTNTVWNTPYISSLKVGALSAVAVNTGGLNVTGNVNITSGGSLTGPGFSFTNSGATFSGALSAATGTFSGNLSAAGGTFSGSISGASGTFTGNLSGSSISGATITGTTFTGGLFQTASSGNRVAINDSSDNTLKIYSTRGGTPGVLVAQVGNSISGGGGINPCAVFGDSTTGDSGVYAQTGAGYAGYFSAGANGYAVAALSTNRSAIIANTTGTQGQIRMVGTSAPSGGHGAGPGVVQLGVDNDKVRIQTSGALGTLLDTNHITISSSTPSGGSDGDIWITT
jgi:hypothetical protein